MVSQFLMPNIFKFISFAQVDEAAFARNGILGREIRSRDAMAGLAGFRALA
jgi:hypothetical protein